MSRIARGERLRRYASRVVASCRDDFYFLSRGVRKIFFVLHVIVMLLTCHRDVVMLFDKIFSRGGRNFFCCVACHRDVVDMSS